MYYVYLLKNSKTNKKYIGCTKDWEKRFKEHNKDENNTWEIIYYEAYLNKDDAFEREKKLKHHGRAKQELYKRCQRSME